MRKQAVIDTPDAVGFPVGALGAPGGGGGGSAPSMVTSIPCPCRLAELIATQA